MEVITLLSLVLAIFIGFKKNINTGLVSIFFAFLVGVFLLKLSAKEIISGWPTNLFFILLGMTFLFSIASVNGTLELISRKLSSFARGNTKLLPIIFFIVTAVIAAPGPGPIVATALMAPIGMALAKEEDIPEILMATMIVSGAIAGGLSPIAATGIITNTLAQEQGLNTGKTVFLTTALVGVIMALLFYIIFGGYKLKQKGKKEGVDLKFNSDQKKTFIVILLVIVGILFFDLDIGLTAFSGAVVLLLMGVAKQDKALAAVPWSTLILVAGVAVLVNVINIAGGIEALSNFLSSIMSERTASAIIAIIAGLMSAVSSASGVVIPTLVPAVPNIVNQVSGSVSPYALVAAIAVGAHMVTFSPLSTLGALTLASSKNEENKQKLFTQLLAVGLSSVVFAGILGLLGLYNIFI